MLRSTPRAPTTGTNSRTKSSRKKARRSKKARPRAMHAAPVAAQVPRGLNVSLTALLLPGQHIGRPKVLDDKKAALALRMHATGESASTIATALGVSRATVYRVLAESTDQIGRPDH